MTFIKILPKFQPGETVICVDDDFSELLSRQHSIPKEQMIFPKEKKTYTVREMIFVPHRNDWGVLLVEIKNKVLVETKYELNFSQTRFEKPNEGEGLTKKEDEAITLGIEKLLQPKKIVVQ